MITLYVFVFFHALVRFYSGAVELCMKAAELRDKECLALRLYHSAVNVNDPDVDPEFRKAYASR